MYDYHSARNMVQLIGIVETEPKEYELIGGDVVRFMIRIRDRDDEFKPFYTEHAVVLPKEIEKRCSRNGISQYDTVLVKGRLSNYRDKKTGKRVSNVQVHEILRLKKNKKEPVQHVVVQPEENRNTTFTSENFHKMMEDPRYQEGRMSGKIVSLMNERAKRDVENEEDEFLYEDEDDPYQIPF